MNQMQAQAMDRVGELAGPIFRTPCSVGSGENLHTFLDAAAAEGFVLGGVDAADLYIEIFPERYAAAIAAATEGAES